MRENVPAQACAHCEQPLFSAVAFCPYCGAATGTRPAVGGAQPLRRPAGSPQAMPAPPAAAPVAPITPAVAPASAAAEASAAQAPAAAAPPTAASTPATAGPAPGREAERGAAAPAFPPPPAAAVPPRRRRRAPWLLLSLAGLGVAGYLQWRSAHDGPCQDALSVAARLLAQGDATGARSQAVLAQSVCRGDAAARARALQASADQALAARAACTRALQGARAHLDARRLRSARTQLDELDAACARADGAGALRQRLEQALRTADATADSARKQLVLGDTRGAQASLNLLQTQDREHPELQSLRAELRSALAVPPPAPAPAPVPPVSRAPVPAPASPPAAPAPVPGGGTPVLAQSFLRDAERALAQSRFDAARTYVDSALRIDPGNAQAASLLRRIRERELQVLREGTTIR